MPKVLITGYRGFTGIYVAERLRARGMSVLGLVQGEARSAEEVGGDLTRSDELAELVAAFAPNYVIHLAALSFVGHGDSREFYDVNLFGTLNLLEALARLPTLPKRVIVASSANVYGAPGLEVLDESVCPSPVNHYANSKLAMEHMLRPWFERMSLVIVRPFNYTGVGQDAKFLIPKIVSHFKRKAEVIELGNLDVARDFSDVRDVAEAYALLLESNVADGATVNICSGRAYALREILEHVSELSGHRLEVRTNPAFVRTNEVPKLVGDNTRLFEMTGFRPNILLEDTLRWMLQA